MLSHTKSVTTLSHAGTVTILNHANSVTTLTVTQTASLHSQSQNRVTVFTVIQNASLYSQSHKAVVSTHRYSYSHTQYTSHNKRAQCEPSPTHDSLYVTHINYLYTNTPVTRRGQTEPSPKNDSRCVTHTDHSESSPIRDSVWLTPATCNNEDQSHLGDRM